jgi:hypothetical protein
MGEKPYNATKSGITNQPLGETRKNQKTADRIRKRRADVRATPKKLRMPIRSALQAEQF